MCDLSTPTQDFNEITEMPGIQGCLSKKWTEGQPPNVRVEEQTCITDVDRNTAQVIKRVDRPGDDLIVITL